MHGVLPSVLNGTAFVDTGGFIDRLRVARNPSPPIFVLYFLRAKVCKSFRPFSDVISAKRSDLAARNFPSIVLVARPSFALLWLRFQPLRGYNSLRSLDI